MDKPTYTRCIRCNRILKTDEARSRGYGNYCWHIHQLEIKQRQRRLFDIHSLVVKR